ncbi:radical SAM protein [Candidatus Woesearchaeota archaeon]|nr:radical SAM protein [Candidatus Woesearchaeota archaeon]
MKEIKKNQNSVYLNSLPKGCKYCKKGEKLVLFITGICPRKCFYCPLSDTKNGKDLIWANEWQIDNKEQLLEEAKLINAKGAGITGGDPLARLDRTVEYIKFLKNKFTKNFHIHLYTSLDLVTKENLKKLFNANLDEIRFHPDLDDKKLWEKTSLAKQIGNWDVGIEIPVIPKKYKQTIELIDFIKDKVDFLNLNELEISDNNANSLTKEGYVTIKSSYAIKGSKQMALKIIKKLSTENTKLKVHFCSTTVKDKEQLSSRIKRRAKNAHKDYDYVTEEGMLIRGAIYPILIPEFNYKQKIEKLMTIKNKNKLVKIKEELEKKFEIPNNLIDIDYSRLRILIAPWILEEINIKYKAAIVTEYPTQDQTPIELEYFN